MADVCTTDILQQRLLAWAAWLKQGRQGNGYPNCNVLHQSWMPPAPGQLPSMREAVAGDTRRERALHHCILQLSLTLQNTLVVVYLHRASADEQCAVLACQASTVRVRIYTAKRLLARLLDVAAHGDGTKPSFTN